MLLYHSIAGANVIPLSKPYIGDAEKQAVLDVLSSGMLTQGPRTALLEETFAHICGTKYAVATSSGTAALHIALLAHGIGAGHEVITTPFTFIASLNSIVYTGARPVVVDIEEDTFNINPDLIEAAITPRTRALLPVHLFGYPCDMDALRTIAERHGLALIEDAAQAIGAQYKGRSVGSFGTGCFSLYATKNIMSAEGGMITTDDDVVARECRLFRNHGMQHRHHHTLLGYNARLTDVHAAIGCVQIERLGHVTTRRRANAAYLNTHLNNVITPSVRPDYEHVWHQYTIRLPSSGGMSAPAARDYAVKQLAAAGIGTGVFYPVLAHKQAHLRELGLDDAPAHLPVAERLTNEVLSLPVHPQLTSAELETIAREVNKL